MIRYELSTNYTKRSQGRSLIARGLYFIFLILTVVFLSELIFDQARNVSLSKTIKYGEGSVRVMIPSIHRHSKWKRCKSCNRRTPHWEIKPSISTIPRCLWGNKSENNLTRRQIEGIMSFSISIKKVFHRLSRILKLGFGRSPRSISTADNLRGKISPRRLILLPIL